MGQEKGNHVDPRQIVQNQLYQRTAKALKQHREFANKHQMDSREELLAYVRQCAEELGHTPYPSEVIGSPFLSSQLGGWTNLIQAAGLPPLPGPHIGRVRADRDSEYKRQLQLYRWRKAKKQAKKLEKRRAKKEKMKTVQNPDAKTQDENQS